MTQPEPDDPLKAQYGDTPIVQSQAVTGRKWLRVDELTPLLKDQKVGAHVRLRKQAEGRRAAINDAA